MPRLPTEAGESHTARVTKQGRVRNRSSALHDLSAQQINIEITVFGGDGVKVTPVPIPNTEVKLDCADGTAWAAVWESRTPPDFFKTHPCITEMQGWVFYLGGFFTSGQKEKMTVKNLKRRENKNFFSCFSRLSRSKKNGDDDKTANNAPIPPLYLVCSKWRITLVFGFLATLA